MLREIKLIEEPLSNLVLLIIENRFKSFLLKIFEELFLQSTIQLKSEIKIELEM